MAKVALLIGVSEYQPGLDPLPAAVKDIQAMERVLKDPDMGAFDQVKVLPNPDRHNMEVEIETFFSGCGKDDLALLFFSGHGVKDDGGKLYFAACNTKKNHKEELIRSTAVAATSVHESMKNSIAKRQAIILDCCFSGAFDPESQHKSDSSVNFQSLGAEGRVVLTSSSSIEYSYEQKGSDLSIYTRYLVEGIETGAGDRNEDGFVSVIELHEYAVSRVREITPKMTPKIIVMKDKGFEIILSKAKVTDPKLRYRKAALRCADTGKIRPAGRFYLDELRQKLGLSIEEAREIEADVLRPYQERLANIEKYRQALIAEAEDQYPLSQQAGVDMQSLQTLLGLGDNDILPVHQEIEAQFAQGLALYQQSLDKNKQDQRECTAAQFTYTSESYQQNLAEYKREFTAAIEQEFPLNKEVIQNLKNLQKSLGLQDEDITHIEKPLVEQAEHKQKEAELLRQEAITQSNLGETLYDEGKIEEAIAAYQKAIEIDPNFRQAHYNLGNALKNQKKIEEAIIAYRKAIQIDPNYKEAHTGLGFALSIQGKMEEAIIAFRTAIQIDPNYQSAHCNLGAALGRQGKMEEAIIAFRKAIQIDPNYQSAHYNLGAALGRQGKIEEAIIAFRKAIQIDPNYQSAHYNLGVVLEKQGKIEEAIIAYRTAIQIDPNYQSAHYNLGAALGRQGKIEEAIIAYRKAIQIDPNYTVAHYNLGNALTEQGKIEEAIIAYRKAIQIDPNFKQAHNELGIALKKQGKIEEAIIAYRKAIQIDPNFKQAHYNLGNALTEQGKIEEAIIAYCKALEIDPNFKLAQENLELALNAQGGRKRFFGLF